MHAKWMDVMDVIAKKTRAGISKAQDDYEYWTGGSWLWEAPEYMVTVYYLFFHSLGHLFNPSAISYMLETTWCNI